LTTWSKEKIFFYFFVSAYGSIGFYIHPARKCHSMLIKGSNSKHFITLTTPFNQLIYNGYFKAHSVVFHVKCLFYKALARVLCSWPEKFHSLFWHAYCAMLPKSIHD